MRKLFFIIILTFPVVIFSQNLNNGLVAYYSFNKNLKDQSLNSNDAQAIGNLKYVKDRFNRRCGAAYFNGTNYIYVPNSPSLKNFVNNISICAWIKADKNAKWLSICCKSDKKSESLNSPQYRFQLSHKQLSLNTLFTVSGDFNFDFEKWNFLCLTYDSQKVRLYVNGKNFYEEDFQDTLFVNNYNLEIGRDVPGSTEYFTGAIDELWIYNRALSDKEIQILLKKKSQPKDTTFCADSFAFVNLVFLLDISASMTEEIDLLKNTFKSLLRDLRPQDFVAIIAFTSHAKKLLDFTSCADSNIIINVLDSIQSGGGTNLMGGLKYTYNYFSYHYQPKYNNRIIVATDGTFSFGITKSLRDTMLKYNKIYLSVFHFSSDSTEKKSLKDLTHLGNGNYYIINQQNMKQALWREITAIKK